MQKLTANDIFRYSSYKLQVRDIFAMYNHEWDVIGEIIQNAVDSVMKRRETAESEEFQPEIKITYDLTDHSITVRDNGLGMHSDLIIKAIAPHYSGKEPSGTNRGEFGVGLAFVAFSSSEFQVKSCYDNKKSILHVNNGYEWAMSDDAELSLDAVYKEIDEDCSNYSEIYTKPIRFPFFSLGKLTFILQRYTAIGDFWAAYNDEDGPIKIDLTYISDDEQIQEHIPNRLWHPADYLEKLDREVVDYTTLKDIDESPRHNAIPNYMGSGMIRKGKMVRDGKEFAYYALMCYSHIYKELAELIGLGAEISSDDNDDDLEEDSILMPEVDLYPGIFVCKKGMPLGADVPRPPRAGTGNWAAFYIVVHSDVLRTEPGRKKLNIEDERIIQKIARSVHNEMDRLSAYVISRVSPDTKQEAIIRAIDENRQQMTEWKATHPIENEELKIQIPVEPPNEQTLIALFHELIGAGLLKGYKAVKISASDTYDGLYDYNIDKNHVGSRAFDEWLRTLPTAKKRREAKRKNKIEDPLIVVEFKLKLESIIRDFLKKSKYHSNIKLLVAWDANEESIKRRGWFLDKRPTSEIRYYGANYILRPSSEGQSKGIQSTHVLLVKRFIDSVIERENG